MDETTHDSRRRTVAQLAELAGVTVRTLHHYDRIGMLVPSARSYSGYRLYDDADLARLREILVWRRLDVPLAEIARLLDDPAIDRDGVLRRQRALVGRRIDVLHGLAEALDRALAGNERTGDERMATDRDIIEALDGFDPADHEQEARERWGDTDAWRVSARRAKGYGPDDWVRIKGEGDAITARLAELFTVGADPIGAEAIEQAEAWRGWITRWFYDCTPEIQRGLGELYVTDPRFTTHYDGDDGERAGMAAWLRTAFAANADRVERG